MEYLLQRLHILQGMHKMLDTNIFLKRFKHSCYHYLHLIKSIGFTTSLENYERRKLGIFNLLNFLQLLTGMIVPLIGLSQNSGFTYGGIFISCLPALTSIIVLYLNFRQQHEVALTCYFALYPFLTCVVFINGINLGNELFFILYGVLSVFFLRDIWHMLFTIAFSMISYFVLVVLWNQRQYSLAMSNLGMYRFNQALAGAFIFYGLYLIKKQTYSYQFSILRKNTALRQKNMEINLQRNLLIEKAALLTQQKEELGELNALKNKLFSVIAHDLKTPMYGLRNLFRNMEAMQLSSAEVQAFIPEVVKDLNYTTSLMENLLQWSKIQMEAHTIQHVPVDIQSLINEVILLLRLQTQAKQILIDNTASTPVIAMADKEMIGLVLRNLLTNAVKFTPQGGKITIGVNACEDFVEVYVQDTGTGISKEALQKINENNYFTTKGTASESGTGLGLMLCRDFLSRNSGQLFIESKIGEGSTFSFTLPAGELSSSANSPV